MNKLQIPHNAFVFVGDGRKALFLHNAGDENNFGHHLSVDLGLDALASFCARIKVERAKARPQSSPLPITESDVMPLDERDDPGRIGVAPVGIDQICFLAKTGAVVSLQRLLPQRFHVTPPMRF